MYCVLVLGLQYSYVLGFPNTCSLFCYFSNTIQYYTILQKSWSEEGKIYEWKTEWVEEEEEKHSKVQGRTKEVEMVRDKKRRRGGFAESKSGWGMKRGRGRRTYDRLSWLEI